MNIPFAASLARRCHTGLAAFTMCLKALVQAVSDWFDILLSPSELDALSDEQLADIGLRRFSRRERWVDGRETSLAADSDYDARPKEP